MTTNVSQPPSEMAPKNGPDLAQDPMREAGSPANKAKNALKTALKIAFAGALIAWLVHKNVLDIASLKTIATPPLILFCLATVGLQIFANNYRWLTLMRAQGFESTIGQTMPLSLIGMFFNFAMPGGVGGDVVKGFYVLKQHPEKKFAAAVSIFMDRLIGFFVMIATAFVALFLNWSEVSASPQLKSVALGVSVLFAAFIVFFALSFSSLPTAWIEKLPAGRKIRSLYEILHSYRQAPFALFIAVLMSAINQVLIVAFVAAIGHALGVDIPLAIYFFLVPIGTVAQALPISPAGIGVGQTAFFFLFKLHLHQDSPIGPVAVTASQISSFAWGLIGAYYYLRISHRLQSRRA
jgi:uncharacterized protein (TIRG00374 family)